MTNRFRSFLCVLARKIFALRVPCGFRSRHCVGAADQAADQMKGLSWRLIGPFRGGRVSAVAGIAGDPKTYYMGTPGGGVWKTTTGGVTWVPIFDDAHVASIGDLVVAPSDPNTIYVATGEQTPGNGVWKSTDAGAHLDQHRDHRLAQYPFDPGGSQGRQHGLCCGSGRHHAQQHAGHLQIHRRRQVLAENLFSGRPSQPHRTLFRLE